MPDSEFQLTSEPLSAEAPGWDGRFGAEVSFVGVVRDTEDEDEIAGIEYSAYPQMAQKALLGLANQARSQFGEHRASLTHRTGFVAAAEPSVILHVSSAHSGDAFEICAWYLAELKRAVPIWKHIVPKR